MPAGDNHFSALVEPAELRFDAPASESLLTSARRAGIDMPASCRNGTCRTCICRVVSGRVRHGIEWPGLSADEKREGFILPCVAYPESDVVLHVPSANRLKPA